MTDEIIEVKLVRSLIGTRESHRATVRALGLKRVNSVSKVLNTPENRGRINKVSYLLKTFN